LKIKQKKKKKRKLREMSI